MDRLSREGNGWSYHYARRQWSLADNDQLRYRGLELFDRDMIHLAKQHSLFARRPKPTVQDIGSQVLIFTRGSLLFVFNLSPNRFPIRLRHRSAAGKYIFASWIPTVNSTEVLNAINRKQSILQFAVMRLTVFSYTYPPGRQWY
jgi:hypothetical protein